MTDPLDLLTPALNLAAHVRACPDCGAYWERLRNGTRWRWHELRCCEGRNLAADVTGGLGD